MGVRWPYSCYFVGCCLQDLFNIVRSILVSLPSSFFSIRLVSVPVVHPYSSIDTTTAWKKLRFILSVRSDFHMTDSLSIAVHAFVSRVLMSFSVDETLLPMNSHQKCLYLDRWLHRRKTDNHDEPLTLRLRYPNFIYIYIQGGTI